MTMVRMVKATKDTHLFRQGQKLWVLQRAGELSRYVVGKHRGNNRYIKAWIHEGEYTDEKEFEVADDFAERHGLKAGES